MISVHAPTEDKRGRGEIEALFDTRQPVRVFHKIRYEDYVKYTKIIIITIQKCQGGNIYHRKINLINLLKINNDSSNKIGKFFRQKNFNVKSTTF